MSTAACAGSRWEDGLGDLQRNRVEALRAPPVHWYYCYPPEKVLQKPGEGCLSSGDGPFEFIPSHHCCQNKGLDVTVPIALVRDKPHPLTASYPCDLLIDQTAARHIAVS